MAKPTDNQVHLAGRHLTVAEALLKGLDAKPLGARTYIEVNGHKPQVQVAAKGAWQIGDVDRYTAATVEHIVLVDVTDGLHKFYICPGDRLRAEVGKRHDDFLISKGGTHPRNPDNTDSAIYPEKVRKWRNGWGRLSK